MIEFNVDMTYCLEQELLDCVILRDGDGIGYEPRVFYPAKECTLLITESPDTPSIFIAKCSCCGNTERKLYRYCPNCGAKVTKEEIVN